MSHRFRIVVTAALLALLSTGVGTVGAEPSGTITWGVHVTLATRWLDTAETDAEITPFMVMYALHDALVKPMPSGLNTASLAESWSMSKDGRVWEFVLRKGPRFHNGDPVTAEDVKFSFERYRGAAAPLFKARVREVQVVDPSRVRFHLTEAWPDFMTFYGTSASGAAWIVPKKYIEKVGEDGFRRAPVGAGPYKFVSFQPGIELVLEAFEGYWRNTPSIKRVVMRSLPEESTRAAALKRGEVDGAYFFNGPIAEDIRRTPGLTLTGIRTNGLFFLVFPEQWTQGSPWVDVRVRRAASLAIDREAINVAESLGFSAPTGGVVPRRAGHSARPVRSQAREGHARRSRLSQWLRRRRLHAVPTVQRHGRGDRELLHGRGHQGPRADHGACRLSLRLARQEAQERFRRRDGRGR